jgi:hypothetical protein
MTTLRKQKEPRSLVLTPRLAVTGIIFDVLVSQISNIGAATKASCQVYLPRHSPLHRVLLRPCKSDDSRYRLINTSSPYVQAHLSRLKPETLIEAFVIDTKGEEQDTLDDFIFGELASLFPKPENTRAAKPVVNRLIQSREHLDVVINGFELDVRSPNVFPTNAIAKLIGLMPTTITNIIKELELTHKWDSYAAENNLYSYDVMIGALAQNKKFKTAFINKLREYDTDSQIFGEFATNAAKSISDLIKGAD